MEDGGVILQEPRQARARTLPPTATQHTIPIEQVEQILLGARRRGADIDAILRRANIAPTLLISPLARVTEPQYANLMRILARSLGDELWGLCTKPVPLGSFAHACRIMLRCRDLGDAIRTGLRHYRLLLHDFVPRLRVDGAVARISLMPRLQMNRALAYGERCFCYQAYGLLCWLSATRLPVLALELPEADFERTAHAAFLFQAPVERVSRCTGIRIDASLLDLPIVQNEAGLREFLQHSPANLLARYRDRSKLTEQVRRMLTAHLAGELPSFEAVGEKLGMTPSTLRRRLRQERQSFGKIRDDLRRDAAIGYLARPEHTLPEIAALVGFSEASTFHRAFKQWTGMAPGEYRRNRLGSG